MKCKIELLVAPGGCSKCARAKEKIQQVLQDYKGKVVVKETDITKDPSRLVQLGIMGTPAVLVNGKLAFEGVPDERKLREKIESCLA